MYMYIYIVTGGVPLVSLRVVTLWICCLVAGHVGHHSSLSAAFTPPPLLRIPCSVPPPGMVIVTHVITIGPGGGAPSSLLKPSESTKETDVGEKKSNNGRCKK